MLVQQGQVEHRVSAIFFDFGEDVLQMLFVFSDYYEPQIEAVFAFIVVIDLGKTADDPGDAFDLTSFLFRFSAGVFFGALFLARGFGVAAGTHAFYDILVSML